MLSCGFSGCGISGVDWSALVEERKRDMGFLPFDSLERCSLRHCLFYGLDLKGFDFSGADLDRQHLRQLRAGRGGLFPVPPGGDSFLQNDLRQADFRQAVGYSFSLEGNRVRGAKFSLPEAVGLLSALGLSWKACKRTHGKRLPEGGLFWGLGEKEGTFINNLQIHS